MKLRNLNLQLLATLMSVAAGSTAEAQWKGTIHDSSGIRIIANTEQGSWDASAAWRVEPELTIGISESWKVTPTTNSEA